LLNRLYTEVYGKYVEFKEGGMRLQDIIMTRSEEVAAEVEAKMKAEMKLVQARSEERTREIVRNMKKIGLSAEQIAQVSGFSVKEVEEL
jgi:predicted transposase YdaD